MEGKQDNLPWYSLESHWMDNWDESIEWRVTPTWDAVSRTHADSLLKTAHWHSERFLFEMSDKRRSIRAKPRALLVCRSCSDLSHSTFIVSLSGRNNKGNKAENIARLIPKENCQYREIPHRRVARRRACTPRTGSPHSHYVWCSYRQLRNNDGQNRDTWVPFPFWKIASIPTSLR